MPGDRDKAVRGQFSLENGPVARADDDHGELLRGPGEGRVGGVAGLAGGVGEEQEPRSARRRIVRGNRRALEAGESERRSGLVEERAKGGGVIPGG